LRRSTKRKFSIAAAVDGSPPVLAGTPLPEVIDSSGFSVLRPRSLLETDADPDIPILKQAKAEYAKLQ
jgi:hypothetical protein